MLSILRACRILLLNKISSFRKPFLLHQLAPITHNGKPPESSPISVHLISIPALSPLPEPVPYRRRGCAPGRAPPLPRTSDRARGSRSYSEKSKSQCRRE